MAFSVQGSHGEIRWGYLPAIVFGPWSFEGQSHEGTLSAQIVSRDEFRATQGPLVVVVPAGRVTWRWSVRDLQISGDRLTASVSRL